MIGQLCASTLNVGKFLEKGLLDELINIVVLNGDNNIKKEAIVCISKVSVTRARVPGGTWIKFYWVCAAGTSEPLPHYSLFFVYFVAKYRHHLSYFWVL